MRNAARPKMGFYPLPESEGVKLRSLLTYTQPASLIDPCVGQGAALHLVTRGAPVRRYGIELDAERARIAGSTGIETIQGNAFDAVAKAESFSLLYLNPPYDSEIGSIANRRMEAVFLEHTYRRIASDGPMSFAWSMPMAEHSSSLRRRRRRRTRAMENAHLRLGLLEYVRMTEKTSTRIRLRVNRYMGKTGRLIY